MNQYGKQNKSIQHCNKAQDLFSTHRPVPVFYSKKTWWRPYLKVLFWNPVLFEKENRNSSYFWTIWFFPHLGWNIGVNTSVWHIMDNSGWLPHTKKVTGRNLPHTHKFSWERQTGTKLPHTCQHKSLQIPALYIEYVRFISVMHLLL